MAKEVKPRQRNYIKFAKLEFNGKWTVDGNDINSIIFRAVNYFNAYRLNSDSDVYSYYNVRYSSERLLASEQFWNFDIIQSWLDMFHDNVACAVYLEAHNNTPGNEKAKYKAADAAFAAYQKIFA